MAFKDYSLTPSENTELEGPIYVGPNMFRDDVRPAIQQLMADGRGLYELLLADPDIADQDAAQSAIDAEASADIAAAAAAEASLAAAAASSDEIFASTADALSNGVISTTALVGGSGGTNGAFDLAFSGGGGTGAAGRFVVSGGAVTSVILTAHGINYTSAPTISFAASAGLTGASATAVIGQNISAGEYFLVAGTGNTYATLYRNVAGVATDQGVAIPSMQMLTSFGYRYNYVATPTEFSDSVINTDQGTHIETSALARAVFSTSATSIRVHGYTDIYASFSAFAELGLLIDGDYEQSIAATANGFFVAEIALAAGTKTITIVNGLQSKVGGVLLGTYLVSVEADAPFGQTTPAETNRALFLADSIGVGANADTPTQNSYISRLRGVTSDSMTVYGWGFNTSTAIMGDSTKRAALMALITPLAPTRIVDTLGTNDYALSEAVPTVLATAKAALYDAIHAALPSAQIFAVKPILRSDEGAPNGLGYTIANYRAAFDTAASGRAWVTVVDGSAFMATSELDDGTHPNTYGHLLWAQGIDGSLGYTVPDDPTGTNPMNAGPDALGTLIDLTGGVYTVEKTSGSGGFNCGFYSAVRAGDFRYQLHSEVACDIMIGVNTDAGTQSGYADMLHQVYATAGGSMSAYDGSTAGGSLGGRGGGTAGDIWVDRTGTTVTFKMGATWAGAATLRTETVAGDLALDLSIFQVGGKETVTVVV